MESQIYAKCGVGCAYTPILHKQGKHAGGGWKRVHQRDRFGMPFRDAYEVTGRLAAMCIEQQKTLEDLTLDELKKASSLFKMSTKQSIWRIVRADAR